MIRFLQRIRLFDEKGNLSLTNIALMIIIVKIAMTQATSFEDISILFLAISSYRIKSHFVKGKV